MAKDKSDRSWFARHKVLTGLIILVIGGVGIAALGGDDTPTTPKEYRFADRADKQDKDVEVAIGEAGTLDNVKVTVNSAERKTSLGEFSDAATGKTFLVINVTIENGSDKAVAYNGFDFRVQTVGGQVLDQAFESVDPSLGSGDTVQGGKVTGNVVFEVPVEEGAQYVIWKPNAVKSDRVIVQIP